MLATNWFNVSLLFISANACFFLSLSGAQRHIKNNREAIYVRWTIIPRSCLVRFPFPADDNEGKSFSTFDVEVRLLRAREIRTTEN